jgi:hypothetical protein
MLSPATCPACGAGWDAADLSCPACGFFSSAAPRAEDLIASWVATSAPAESPSTDRDTVCVACGYEGPMVASPDGHPGPCPACGDPWPDRADIIRKVTCPDCGEPLPLTEGDRGKTIICPGCRSFLGCLMDRQGRE